MPRPRATSTSSEVSSAPSSSTVNAGGHAPQELSSMYDYLAKIILLGPSGTGKSCLLHRFVKNEWRVLSSQTIGVEFSSKIVKIGSGATRRRVKLQLWDTAGTERFRSVSRSYYRGAAGAILVYDVASLNSFHALPTFLMDARSLASPGLTVVLAGNKADLADPTNSAHNLPQTPSTNGSWKEPPPMPSSLSSSRNSAAFPPDSPAGRSRGDSINLSVPGTRWRATPAGEAGREVSADVASRWASKSSVPAVMDVSALTGDNVDELFNRLARMILTKIELGEIDPDDPNSGIQYGDVGGWGDGGSVGSAATGADEGGTLRRRKKRSKVLLNGMGEWGDVFRKPGGGRGGCC